MVAFIASLIITVLLVGGIFWYGGRRPTDAYLTWGDAMFGATYVFLLLFWVYGVVPHQWITWADGELNWRPDAVMVGWGGILEPLPFEMSLQTLRDLIVVGIYGIAIAGNVAVWAWWQKRGTAKPAAEELETSEYGRPLVKQEA